MKDAKYMFFLLPLILALTCAGAFAQANSAITGIVADQTGAVVSSARVELIDLATGGTRVTTSNDSGLYEVAGLNAGKYDMVVTAKGFETYTKKAIVVNISATFRVDVTLTVGAATQTVTVAADALTVQADSNVVSTLISQQQIAELPMNGRNVIALATFGTGVSGNLPDAENPFSVNANYAISFNGLSQAHNIWMIDGAEEYDRGSGGKMSVMPSQDSLQEFQVLSSNYGPDTGLATGGAVTISLKSGTSQFHGEAWEFDRNDAIDAHSYFDNNKGQDTAKAELRYNVFGANLGGPFYIPNHYNSASKNKTFFFYNEEWRKMVNGVSTNPIKTMPSQDLVSTASTFTFQVPLYSPKDQFCTVPTDPTTGACPSGDANPLGQIIVPTVSPNSRLGKALANHENLVMGQPFPGNVIPGDLLDPNALTFNTTKNLPPATDLAGDTYTPSGGHLPINVREELFRVDHNINDKWALLGHFIHDANDSEQATPEWQGDNYPTVGSNFSNPSYSAVIKLTGSLRPDVLLEAAFDYDGNKIAIIPVARSGASFVKPSGWNTGMYFPNANDVGNRLPDINWKTIGNTWGPGNDPWTNGAEDYAENVALSVTHGKHNMKFGGGYNRYTKNQVIGKDSEGDYNFDDGWMSPTTALPTQHAPTGVLTGDSFLDFLLGVSTKFSESNANPINHYVNNNISVFVMDNWRMTPRLSVQYGVRYDAMPHVWERNNQVSNFVPSLYQPALAAQFDSNSGAFLPNSPGLQTVNLSGVPTSFYLNGVALAGQNGVPRALVKNDYRTVMPRFGFSYDMFGNGKTILRAGFGTFYERIQGNDIYDAAGSPPFISTPAGQNVEFTNTQANWQSGGTAATPSFPQSYNSLNTHYPDPGVAEFSFGIQRELAPAIILTAEYVGNVQWDQNDWIPINNFPLSTSPSVRSAYANGTLTKGAGNAANALLADTYPGFGQLRLQSTPDNGTYNSLQAGLRQESKWGLSYGVYYTWSHQIDDTEGSVDVDNNNPAYNPWNMKYDKGSGSLDRRNILNINYEYKLPLYAHGSGLAHSVLGGWEIAGSVIAESGMPWFAGYAPKNSYGDTVGLGGDYSSRPDITGKPHYVHGKATLNGLSLYRYLDSTNFSAPVAGWAGGPNLGFGNMGKDAVVGAGRTNFNTSLYKTFTFTERANFEFRADTFNTFNHTQFNALQDTSPQNADFGFVSGAQDPRVFEFGGKITF
jgi:hypothetical protein